MQQALPAESALLPTAQLQESDHPVIPGEQQTMHAYGTSSWTPAPDPDAPNFRTGYFQSLEDWSFDQRQPDAVLTFDTATMDLGTVCVGQGAWSAQSRHGQTTITEHPRPYRRNFRSVIPMKTDTVLDTAQFRGLFEHGAPITHFEEACQRQTVIDTRHDTLSRAFTTKLSLGCDLHTQWGASALTWDFSYSAFVSADPADTIMGSKEFEEALPEVADGSLILIDHFNDEQQHRILERLGAATAGKWVVIAGKSGMSKERGAHLNRIGFKHDELLAGHQLGRKALSWRTGDVSLKKHEGMSSWIPKYAEIDTTQWQEWLDPADEHPGDKFKDLTQAEQDYW